MKAKDKLAVAVAYDGVGGGLAVARLKLAYRLAHHRATDLATTNDREHIVDVR